MPGLSNFVARFFLHLYKHYFRINNRYLLVVVPALNLSNLLTTQILGVLDKRRQSYERRRKQKYSFNNYTLIDCSNTAVSIEKRH